jgi:hypothetical protein
MAAATFQTTVNQFMGFGIPGEIYDSGPYRAMAYTLLSADASYNVFGRGFSQLLSSGDGYAAAGNTTGALPFAGILMGPKNYALKGDGTNPLNPGFTLPNYEIGQLCTMGQIVVTLSNIGSPGLLIVMDNITGILTAITQATPLPVGKSPCYAQVVRYNSGGPSNVCVIELDPTIIYTPAA